MNVTSLVNRIFFKRRYEAIERYRDCAESIQRNVLEYLIHKASGTQWGREHAYSAIGSYEQFAVNVPVCSYDHNLGRD